MTRRGMRNIRRRSCRPSFTLVELLVVTAIITILASAVLFAMWGVVEQAKAARTRAQIAKLHSMIMREWEAYSTRVLRVSLPAGLPVMPEPFVDNNGSGRWETGEAWTPTEALGGPNGCYDNGVARVRTDMIRDLMRMELPDRKSDLYDGPATIVALHACSAVTPARNLVTLKVPEPARWKSFRRRVNAIYGIGPPWRDPGPDGNFGTADDIVWTEQYQGAECLYVIVASIREGESTGLDFFKEKEIGDVDGDGMREILDGWGNPIEFIRWAPGYATNPGPDGGWGVAGVDDDNQNGIDDFGERGFPWSDDESDLQTRDGVASPDPFDPLKTDTRATYRLIPLIISAGPDGSYHITAEDDIAVNGPVRYANGTVPDPFLLISGQPLQMGKPNINDLDNITNHLVETD